MLQARLNQDDHANPSLQVRPDGRLVVFYSRHVGPAMHYRVSTQPEDVTSWGAPQTIPTNSPGIRGYTYPNPIRLEDESRHLPVLARRQLQPHLLGPAGRRVDVDAARDLIAMPGERPYVKYDSSGGDTIHVAYTNAHPNEFPNVNIYYARVRAGTSSARAESRSARSTTRSRPRGRPRLRRRRAGLGARRGGRLRRQPGDRVRELPVGGRPPLPLRALDRHRVGRPPDHAGRRDVPRGRRLPLLLRRPDARPRGPVAGVPLAPGRRRARGRWRPGRPRRRRDLDARRRHEQLGKNVGPSPARADPPRAAT